MKNTNKIKCRMPFFKSVFEVKRCEGTPNRSRAAGHDVPSLHNLVFIRNLKVSPIASNSNQYISLISEHISLKNSTRFLSNNIFIPYCIQKTIWYRIL